jgi:hypothetical protein
MRLFSGQRSCRSKRLQSQHNTMKITISFLFRPKKASSTTKITITGQSWTHKNCLVMTTLSAVDESRSSVGPRTIALASPNRRSRHRVVSNCCVRVEVNTRVGRLVKCGTCHTSGIRSSSTSDLHIEALRVVLCTVH